MKLKFLVDDGDYKKGEIYTLSNRDAVNYLRRGSADVYHEKYEKAVKK